MGDARDQELMFVKGPEKDVVAGVRVWGLGGRFVFSAGASMYRRQG